MATSPSTENRVRIRRVALGLTQEQLATRAGVSRTAVTAIESARLSPSVAAALAIAAALGATVEELFGATTQDEGKETWAWAPSAASYGCWRAEVGGRVVSYPATSEPILTPLADRFNEDATNPPAAPSDAETLVLAGCDPAAGLLSSRYFQTTGLRLLVLPRSGRQALELLKQGLVHLAGLHFATDDDSEGNARAARELAGDDCQLLRLAHWQEGVVAAPSARVRSVRSAVHAKLTWIGREPGSGARQCLDGILKERQKPKRLARRHRAVAEAVQSGWADAGVCVQLAGVEAGLDFFPVRQEAYDLCYRTDFAADRRMAALMQVVRSSDWRKIVSALPGYDAGETGQVAAF